jgi:anti-sigma factor RsiW
MTSCKDIIDLLSDYLEGDLPHDLLGDFEAHMALCSPCVVFLNSLKQTRSLVRGLQVEEVPPEVQQQLRTFLQRARKGLPKKSGRS